MPSFASEDELDERLSRPTSAVVELFARMPGDFLFLGVAGKMGPSLARMARRAADEAGTARRVLGVSRFSSGGEAALSAHGIETVRCDLLSAHDVQRLPDAANVVFMTGKKFGSTGDEATTWAVNSYLPGLICERFRHSRIVAFSTGNVYGLSPVARGGSREEDRPCPVGEYAMSALGRERVFEYFSRALQIPTALVRLNYACDLRYGVLVDLANQVLANNQPIDLAMGYFNTIWQQDANAQTLLSFEHAASPAFVVNVTGPELLRVRDVAQRLAQIMNVPVRFQGSESETALLTNSERARRLFGPPQVNAEELVEAVGRWAMQGGRQLDKPTHFESRSGAF
jgi:nucleoside-diphosphate-sugar epimerase